MKHSIKTLALAAVSAAALLSQAANAAPSLSINQTSGPGTVSFAVSIDNPEALVTGFNINLALSGLGQGQFASINWGTMFGTLDYDPSVGAPTDCLSNLLATGCKFDPVFSGGNVAFGAFAWTDMFGVANADLKLWQNFDTVANTYAPSILLATLTFNADEQGQYGARVADDACPGPNPNNPDATYVSGHAAGVANDGTTDGYIYPACNHVPVPEPASLGLLGLGLLGTMAMRRRVAA